MPLSGERTRQGQKTALLACEGTELIVSRIALRRIRIPRWISGRRIARRILSRLLLLRRRRHLPSLRRHGIGLRTRRLLLGVHDEKGGV